MRNSILLVLIFTASAYASEIVNDVTQINPIRVSQVIAPQSVEEIQKLLRSYHGIVSIGGGRYSMGGQTATENALQIDMRSMNKVLNLDIPNKKITVQAGMRWRDIQDVIDPVNLSIKVMQTYSNFTVGGSLSVNVHGRYIGEGPVIRTVDSIKVVLADGSLVEATPKTRSDVFYGAIGGYGGVGVIVEATLQLTDNVKVERVSKTVPAKEYKHFFMSHVRDNPKVVFHNGDIYPPNFETVNAVSWEKTDKPLTIQERMIQKGVKYSFQPRAISVLNNIPMGRKIRSSVVDPYLYKKGVVSWRNHEASYDVAELEPPSRKDTTFVLQEYFVPVKHFEDFILKMRAVFNKHEVKVFNVSIRHALPDPGSVLAWAPNEVFAFVVYYEQGTKPSDREKVATWTRELISEVIALEGRYYLPYQIHATPEQFKSAYKRNQEFFDLKKKLDPENRFRNKLWDQYYLSIAQPISDELLKKKDYRRGEEQSFLALPEWYIVFNSDEYAAFLKHAAPSQFPYVKSIREFWRLKSQIEKFVQGRYPLNLGYEVMLYVIGSSYSAELALKGIYENSVGRLTEWIAGEQLTNADTVIQTKHQAYGEFVHLYPWYKFPFYEHLRDFWYKTESREGSFLRFWERRVIFSVEYLFKSVYSWVIRKGTQAGYEPEDSKVWVIAHDPDHTLEKLSEHGQTQVFFRSSEQVLASFPRYDSFRDLSKVLSGTSVRYLEIAGNHQIFLTLIHPRSQNVPVIAPSVVGFSLVPTNDREERLLVATSVDRLLEVLREAHNHGMIVEHVFDY